MGLGQTERELAQHVEGPLEGEGQVAAEGSGEIDPLHDLGDHERAPLVLAGVDDRGQVRVSREPAVRASRRRRSRTTGVLTGRVGEGLDRDRSPGAVLGLEHHPGTAAAERLLKLIGADRLHVFPCCCERRDSRGEGRGRPPGAPGRLVLWSREAEHSWVRRVWRLGHRAGRRPRRGRAGRAGARCAGAGASSTPDGRRRGPDAFPDEPGPACSAPSPWPSPARKPRARRIGTGWSQGVRWRDVVVDRDAPTVRAPGTRPRRGPGTSGLEGAPRTRLELRGRLAVGEVRLLS